MQECVPECVCMCVCVETSSVFSEHNAWLIWNWSISFLRAASMQISQKKTEKETEKHRDKNSITI